MDIFGSRQLVRRSIRTVVPATCASAILARPLWSGSVIPPTRSSGTGRAACLHFGGRPIIPRAHFVSAVDRPWGRLTMRRPSVWSADRSIALGLRPSPPYPTATAARGHAGGQTCLMRAAPRTDRAGCMGPTGPARPCPRG